MLDYLKRYSLTFQFFIGFLLFTVLPMMVVSIISANQHKSLLQEKTIIELTLLNEELARQTQSGSKPKGLSHLKTSYNNEIRAYFLNKQAHAFYISSPVNEKINYASGTPYISWRERNIGHSTESVQVASRSPLTYYKNSLGTKIISISRPVNISGDQLLLVTEIAEKRINTFFSKTKLINIVAFICMLTTFVFLSIVISRQINQPLRKVSLWVQKIAKGDSANCEIINTSFEFENLSRSVLTLNKRQLQYKEYQEQQLWLEHSISGLYKEMNGIMNLGELCSKVTGYLARLINSPAAAMYLVDKNFTLSLKGQYGCSSKGDYLEILQSDDGGLLIEAVKHKEPIEISELPGDFFRIESAHLDKKPDTVYIVPFCYGTRVKGLLAFACLTQPEKKYKQLLSNASSPLASAIHSLELTISGNISAIDLTSIS